MEKRKICVVVTSRPSYSRIRSVLRAIQDHPDLELLLIVGASALLHRFGSVIDTMRAEGFEPTAYVYNIVEGELPITMAKSTGLGVLELASLFESLRPDVVLTIADRFETMATAIAASYMNIPLAHTQGGEFTGSIDDAVRHAITKLAHIHFPATKQAGEILVRMGEDPGTVFLTGCPSLDVAAEARAQSYGNLFEKYPAGTGRKLDWNSPFLVVLQHPVSTEYREAYSQTEATLEAVRKTGMQAVWFWPNVDAGSDGVSKALRTYIAQNGSMPIHFYRNFSPEDFIHLQDKAACLVGNSSSGIREGSYLGTPVVNIGTRQNHRERAKNVIDVAHSAEEIYQAIRSQVAHGKYPSDALYGTGDAGKRIADILRECKLSILKHSSYW
ncbi:MAG: UDP-N-acetylglucosamine 2-epimerase [Candidatus Yanofskybacteria bacterium]|nr:UDP-N-acetylglucosamine 2-epimerase [Candidatus Yanofskybacteria bacterium]